ncbi:MAG: AGE family epimerase/isomerase [Bacteroidota bacterium]|nr:AGE family epimerase/isomerase [Bacteroidota bacterium]
MEAGKLILADRLEESLFTYILEPWYPLVIDTLNGGYHSNFTRNWSLEEESGNRALVQQARHVWATSLIYEYYPEHMEYLDYAENGFRFLKEAMWDQEFGGFHAYCTREGTPVESSIHEKKIYGQAFGVYGLSQYYRVSHDPDALELARKAFLWMEEHSHDKKYGGYFELLGRNGAPVIEQNPGQGQDGFLRMGIKDYNSSIHVMEALTELYLIWPDSLVRERLEEMFYLIRDTFVHPDGYLQLFFEPDWTLVVRDAAVAGDETGQWFLNHFTYGHDVETAFLLLETAHVLGWGEDEKTHHIAKQLVDHSLASGWDSAAGGFYDAGVASEDGIRIINNHKSWWGLVEGMNALLLMHTLYPEDPQDYYALFLKSWEHIDSYLIDKSYGGWFNAATDTYPETVDQPKSHIWKTTYHNARGMVNCIHMLRIPGNSNH